MTLHLKLYSYFLIEEEINKFTQENRISNSVKYYTTVLQSTLSAQWCKATAVLSNNVARRDNLCQKAQTVVQTIPRRWRDWPCLFCTIYHRLYFALISL